MGDVHENIHQERLKSHEATVAKLNKRKAGDSFQDVDGATYEVVRVDDRFPRPGYIAKHLAGPYPGEGERFVGFDSVKERS